MSAPLVQPATAAVDVVPVRELDLAFAPHPWPFAARRRAEIDAHFAQCRRERPALWNGRVLLLRNATIADGVFRGAYMDVDFASFLAWRDWGFPDPTVKNCFAMAALHDGAGAFLLGVMGAHTANAGKIYFPSGTPELADVAGGRVDLFGNLARELHEETGLRADEMDVGAQWYAVLAGPRIATMKPMRLREPMEHVCARVRAHIAGEAEPELADILIARGRRDLRPEMPPFMTAFLTHMWDHERPPGLARRDSLSPRAGRGVG